MKMDLNLLIDELSSIENIQERRKIIFSDIHSPNPRFKAIADESPHLLFEILGGNESNIVTQNWAIEYNYEDYLEEYGVEFDEKESKKWNLEERSIQRAHDLGYWYVTGECLVECENGGVLVFEFQYSEGYLDGIIGTPYNKNDHGNHGIPF
jgi:hypothetical protein